MSGRLAQKVRERIRLSGPMRWPDFMAMALYDPEDGFYTGGQHPAGVGHGTHFATSPTLHPFFSHCVARELAAAWTKAGKPAHWEVVEFGAGTGALARDAMDELRRLNVPARWTAIDVKAGPAIKGGRWMTAPPKRFDAVVANEFLDALPFELIEVHKGHWHRLGVTAAASGPGFDWQLLEPSLGPAPQTPEGEQQVAWLGTEAWLKTLADANVKLAVIIDYGATKPADHVRAYLGHDFADPLSEPGTVDLTADVDFAELGEQAGALGFATALESQEQFLLRHGVFDVLNKIDRTTREGASAYLRLRQLLLPTGFGTAFLVARLTPAAPVKTGP